MNSGATVGSTILIREEINAFSWKDPNATVIVIRPGTFGYVLEIVPTIAFFTFIVAVFTISGKPEILCIVDGEYVRII